MGEVAYRRLADELRTAIIDGQYPPGSQLPSEKDLMQRHGVSRGTIRQTFAQLQHEGIISSHRGSRRRVVDAPRVQSFEELMSFSLWVRLSGERPSGRLVRLVLREATDEEALQLDLETGAPVFHLLRLRLISGRPTMIERSAYPETLGRVVAAMDTERESITERLAQSGYVFAQATHVIDAIPASTEDARLLEIRPRSPLLRTRRRTTDAEGVPLEWSDDRYRADRVAFSVANSLRSSALTRVNIEP
jgi:GntR family transcriptional regulator